jgi:hypothetical protein
MKFKAKYILALAAALFIIIVPAISQGDDRAGMNGMQGNGIGSAGDRGLDTYQDQALWGPGNGNGNAPPKDEKKFMGCNTLPKKLLDKKPIDKPASDKHLGPNPKGGLEPWVYADKDPMNEEFGMNPADPGRRMGPRAIMPDSPQKKAPGKAPKKSVMKDWHKKLPRPRPLMETYHPVKPPIKSIMGHLI